MKVINSIRIHALSARTDLKRLETRVNGSLINLLHTPTLNQSAATQQPHIPQTASGGQERTLAETGLFAAVAALRTPLRTRPGTALRLPESMYPGSSARSLARSWDRCRSHRDIMIQMTSPEFEYKDHQSGPLSEIITTGAAPTMRRIHHRWPLARVLPVAACELTG